MAGAAPERKEVRAPREAVLAQARAAARHWAALPLPARLRVVREIRHGLAESARDFLPLFSSELARTSVDSLSAEILPLAEACRFLERHATHILRPRRMAAAGSSVLFRSVAVEVRREPLGVVLIIGPANYPLFLPGVGALQALVAGNAVVWKPGREGKAVAEAFAVMAQAAGLPPGVLTVVDESPQTAQQLIAAGVDKIVVTGSIETGRAVLEQAAGAVTPVIAELSGSDAFIVHQSADLQKAARALRFGTTLNGGQTCIAPRRLLVHASVAAPFEQHVQSLPIPMLQFATDAEAIELANRSAYALGATVFAQPEIAKRIAARLEAGVVVINDVIAPTADPRVPFGGRRLSGFGVTRGAEGLLEMTAVKSVLTQRARRLRHLEALPPGAEQLFLAYLAVRNGKHWRERLAGVKRLFSAAIGPRPKNP